MPSSAGFSSTLDRPRWAVPPPEASESATAKATKENKLFGTASVGVKIESRPGRGRGLFASKHLKAGDVAYSVKNRPPAAVLSTSNLSTHCSGCFLSPPDVAIMKGKEDETPLKRCSGCKVVHYCSVACSKSDWIFHKPECSAFQLLRKRYKERNPDYKPGGLEFLPYEASRALARLLWTKKRAKDAGESCSAWDEYAVLQSQIDPESDSMAKMRDESLRLAFYVSIITPELVEGGDESALSLLMRAYGFDGNPDLEMLKLWSKYQTNAFTLDSPDLTALGAIVSPGLAMANHSCEPNAVVVFPNGGGLGQITAIRPIKPDEEILVCYIDVASPYTVRQAELSSRYNFTCDCSLCLREKDETFVDPRWCLLHPECKEKGRGRMPDTIKYNTIPNDFDTKGSESAGLGKISVRCSACSKAFTVDERKLYKGLSQAKGLLEGDEKGMMRFNKAASIRAVQAVISALLPLCPPSSHPLIPLFRLMVRLQTLEPPASLRALAIPLHHLSYAIEGAQAIYAPNHPTIAVLLAQKARLLGLNFPPSEDDMKNGRSSKHVRLELRRLEAAMVVYREAAAACAGCFGREGGVVGKGLRTEMSGMETEIQAMRLNFQMAFGGVENYDARNPS